MEYDPQFSPPGAGSKQSICSMFGTLFPRQPWSGVGTHMTPSGKTALGRSSRSSPCRRNRGDGVFFQRARLLPTHQDASTRPRSFWKRKSSSPGWSWLWADPFKCKVVVRNWLLLTVRWLLWFDFVKWRSFVRSQVSTKTVRVLPARNLGRNWSSNTNNVSSARYLI